MVDGAFRIYASWLWNQLLIYIRKSESDLGFESKLEETCLMLVLIRSDLWILLGLFLNDDIEKLLWKLIPFLMITALSDFWKQSNPEISSIYLHKAYFIREEVVKWDTRTLIHKNCMKYSALVHRWKSLCNSGSFWHKISLPLQIKLIYQT